MDRVTCSTDQLDRTLITTLTPIPTPTSAEQTILSLDAANKNALHYETKNDGNNTFDSVQQPSQQKRTQLCRSCQQPCSQMDRSLIRALGGIYHYDCFTCEDCHDLVANKFYALNTNNDTFKFKIVCEYHYRSQMGDLCPQCHQSTSATVNDESIINQPQQRCRCQNRCPECMKQPTMNTENACYEYDGRVYCLLHFSSIKEIQCFGCHQAILKQFVEHRSHPGQKWHPECYMIFKFWNVRLADTLYVDVGDEKLTIERLEEIQMKMEQKINRIWTDLSSFEESSATCISDMLLLVAAGAYVEGFRMASQFVMHLEVLYSALDDVQQQLMLHNKVLPCGKEFKLVCDQVIRFFNLLTQPDNKKMGSLKENGLGVTQELLLLITSLAQNLKTLIRIGLTEVLYLERECNVVDAIPSLLNNLLELDRKRVWIGGRYWFKEDPFPNLLDPLSLGTNHHQETTTWSQCYLCRQSIYSDCFQHTNQKMWHSSCFVCSKCQHPLSNDLSAARLDMNSDSAICVLLCDQCTTSNITTRQSQVDTTKSSFVHLTELQHYIYLLKLALARLHFAMNSSDHDQNPNRTSLLSPVAFVPVTDNNYPPSYQQQSQQKQQQNTGSRTSFFGSVHFGNIKRVKTAHLDRINEHPHDNIPPNNSSDQSAANAAPKRSFTVFEPRKIMPHHRNYSLGASPPSSSSSSLSPGQTGSGVFSTTRRASTSTIQRMGSLRRALSQRRGTERGSVYNLFDRRQSHKQRPQQPQEQQPQQQCHNFDSASLPLTVNKDLQITTAPTQSLRSSSISTHSSILVDSPIATSASMSLVHHQLLPLSPNQYLLVRYIAAKTIATFAPPNMYTMEEWMLLVECRKTSLWGKLKTRIRTPHTPSADHQNSVNHRKVFSVSLAQLTSGADRIDLRKRNQVDLLKKYIGTNILDNNTGDMDKIMDNHAATQWAISCFTSVHCKVPCFVQHCVLALLQRDLSAEGIFRKNGNIRELKQMEDIIDKDTTTDNTNTIDLLAKQTSIQLAALLKRYLRELPEPLLTFRLYPVFVAAVGNKNNKKSEEKNNSLPFHHLNSHVYYDSLFTLIGLDTEEEVKTMLHLACCMLPKENRDTMQVVFGFLQHVSTFKDINKMGIYNLARIMAPSVLHDRTSINNQDMAATSNSSVMTDKTPVEEIKVVDMLIRYYDEFGKTPADMIPFISDHQMVDWFSGMDSKHFAKNYTDLAKTSSSKTSYPPHIQQSSVPTLSTTTASSSDAALSPTTIVGHPFMLSGRKQSKTIRSQPTSPINVNPAAPFMPFMSESRNTATPSSSLSPSAKSFHRRSWMLKKQQHV
ncbi:hypothetical protein BCR42DRAFT_107322 [Absidia repens]|uniref:Rho-GAP domain-containing protein n=1 Tax=Absidia repens TaxID=90262 RepID=A0A1X2I7D1_9FUNG|nr:hypothetical protein BCR42DRAFT_107322 [Absidia repens]